MNGNMIKPWGSGAVSRRAGLIERQTIGAIMTRERQIAEIEARINSSITPQGTRLLVDTLNRLRISQKNAKALLFNRSLN